MRILVTGAFGNVGEVVLREMVRAGHIVRGLDVWTARNRRTARRSDGVQAWWGDVRNSSIVAAAVAGMDAVVHLAAVLPPESEGDPEFAREVNVEGTRNLIDAMASQSRPIRLVFSSSVAVFGHTQDQPPPRRSTDPVRPADHYAKHKTDCEALIRASSLQWTILRLGMVLPVGLVRTDRRAALRAMFDVPLAQRMECVHREDVARAILASLRRVEAIRATLLIGGGPNCQVRYHHIVEASLAAMGIPMLPPLAFTTSAHHGDWMDTTAAQRLLDFQRRTFLDHVGEVWAANRLRRVLMRPHGSWLSRRLLRVSPHLPPMPHRRDLEQLARDPVSDPVEE